jgi:hypothetical protein
MTARRSALFRLLAVGLAPAARGSIAAPADDRDITLDTLVYGHVLHIPVPTWLDKPLVPSVIHLRGEMAMVDFPERPHASRGSFEAATTYIERLRGVRNVEDARAHFRLVHGIDLAEAEKETSRPLPPPQALPWGRAYTVDLSRVGWVPGNVYHYCLFSQPARTTLVIGPTHYIKFDLSGLRIERAK